MIYGQAIRPELPIRVAVAGSRPSDVDTQELPLAAQLTYSLAAPAGTQIQSDANLLGGEPLRS